MTRLEPCEIEELFEIRTMLEVWLFEHSIAAISEEDFAKAQEAMDAMRHAPVKEWGTLNWQFHSALYRAAKKPTTLKLLKRVHDNADRYVRLQMTLSKDAQERAHQQHQAMIDAAHMKDTYLAGRLLSDHINHVKGQIIAMVEAKRPTSLNSPQRGHSRNAFGIWENSSRTRSAPSSSDGCRGIAVSA